MHHHFKAIYSELSTQRDEILEQVKNIASEKFFHTPSPGKWSISQILAHLVTSEKLSLGYMKKKSQGIKQLKNSGVMENVRMWLLIFSQRVPLKYKAPRVVVENTPEALPLDELTRKWNTVRSDLADFLEKLDEKDIRKVIYKHPVGGRLDAKQTLIFFREHINHHRPQIERLLR